MKRKIFFLMAGLFSAAQFTAQAQSDFSQIEIQVDHVAGQVHMLVGSGGNIGVSAGSDGLLMVDSQFAPLAEKISAALRAMNPGPVKYLVNTHRHGDHTGGNQFFGQQGASIIAHRNVRRRMVQDAGDDPRGGGLPVVTFDKSITLHFNGEAIQVFHLPTGHTDGDSVLWFKKSNVLHTGDLFFVDRFPYIDLGSGGDVEGYIRNVGRLIQETDDSIKIIPGHGRLAKRSDLVRFQNTLKDTVKSIRQAMDNGQSLEAITRAGLGEKYQSWGSGFISEQRWIQIVYSSLSQ